MTKALEQAFREASKLPDAEQDVLAEAIQAEIAGEQEWDDTFDDSRQILEKLADEALGERRAGATRPMDPKKP